MTRRRYAKYHWKFFYKFDRKGKKVRLIGLGMSHLNNVGGEQLSLFQSEEQTRRDKVSNLLDTLRAKHGEEAATRASLLGAEPERFESF